MRKIIVSNFITLDGFFEGPDRDISWFVWDEEMEKYTVEFFKSIDAMLFGRVTYDLMASYWPTEQAKNENPAITNMMNDFPKYVFSNSLKNLEWNNSRLIKGDIKEETLKLKEQTHTDGKPSKDIVIFGSGAIVSALTELRLIDEYRIIINPVIFGKGNSHFHGVKEKIRLKFTGSESFKCGNVVVYYSI